MTNNTHWSRYLIVWSTLSIMVLMSACSVGKKHTHLKGIEFDTKDWTLISSTEQKQQWKSEDGDSITVTTGSNSDPTLSQPKQDSLRKLRSQQISASGGAIIELDVIDDGKGTTAVQWIQKNPQKPTGMLYTGTLAFPRPDGSVYTFIVEAPEGGMTGMRDAVVLDKLMGQGEVQPDEKTGKIIGWTENVCDPDDKSQLQRNKSEDAKYDASFPEHPLSRTRHNLEHIRTNVIFSATNQK